MKLETFSLETSLFELKYLTSSNERVYEIKRVY